MVGVNHVTKVLKSNRDAINAHRSLLMSDKDGKSVLIPGAEDMMVLGNITVNHHAPAKQSTDGTGAEEKVEAVVEKVKVVKEKAKRAWWLGKTALSIAMLATGAGTGAGLLGLYNAWKTRPSIQKEEINIPPDTDTKTITKIRRHTKKE